MKENKAQYVILGLLSHMPMSGYDLRKYSEKWISYFWGIGYGQIYPALKDMSKKGLIKDEGAAEGKRAESKVYALTALGKDVLLLWLKNPKQNEMFKSELLLKLFFSGLITPDFSESKIEFLKDDSVRHKKILGAAIKDLEMQIDESRDHPYFLLTAMFGEMYFTMCAEWAEKSLRILRRIKRKKIKRGK